MTNYIRGKRYDANYEYEKLKKYCIEKNKPHMTFIVPNMLECPTCGNKDLHLEKCGK